MGQIGQIGQIRQNGHRTPEAGHRKGRRYRTGGGRKDDVGCWMLDVRCTKDAERPEGR